MTLTSLIDVFGGKGEDGAPGKIRERSSLRINGNASRFEDFFRSAALSTHQIMRVIQGASEKNGVIGLGDHEHIVTH